MSGSVVRLDPKVFQDPSHAQENTNGITEKEKMNISHLYTAPFTLFTITYY